MQSLIDLANNSIYPAQAILSLFGMFCAALVFRRLQSKQFRSTADADQFLEEVHGLVEQHDDNGIAELCDSPTYAAKVVPQLILITLANKQREPNDLRRMLSETFDREVLADLAYNISWLNTVVKTAPLVGLLGTVLGMINAFGKVSAEISRGTAIAALASDVSHALISTAVGLVIAIPIMLLTAFFTVRLGRLQDGVQKQLGNFLDVFDAAHKKEKRRFA